MGLFGKKKKKKFDDFSDEGGDEGPGGMDDGGGAPAFQGSDDNPYADDPAHKHLVKLLDSNGLVRHRRAFIRNSIYTVKHAKECDADRLEKVGVFLEADRKKLLRIFKDAEVVESEVDKQREQEKLDMEGPGDDEMDMLDDEPKKKKKKDKKKDKEKDKKKKKKKDKKKDKSEEEDMDLSANDEDEDGKPKKKKKDKKKKKNKGEDEKKEKKKKKKEKRKKDVDDGDIEEMDELEEGEKKKRKKKGKNEKEKKSKKEKGKGEKKKKKKDKNRNKGNDEEEREMDDLGIDADIDPEEEDMDIGMTPEEELGAKDEDEREKEQEKAEFDEMMEFSKKSKPKKKKKTSSKSKSSKGSKSSKKVRMDVEEENQQLSSDNFSRRSGESRHEHEETVGEVVDDLEKELGNNKINRKMSKGSEALKLLNDKLSQKERQRRKSQVSTISFDEDEEMWWKNLDATKKMTTTDEESESEPHYKQKNKKKAIKVKPEFGAKLEYVTDAEHEVLQNFRQQNKVTRRKRPLSYQQIPPPIPPPVQNQPQHQQANLSLQPPGEASEQIRSPHFHHHPHYPPPPQMYSPYQHQIPQHEEQKVYYTEGESLEEEGSADDFSKYKYYKERYNKRKKLKKQKKYELKKQQMKKEMKKKQRRQKEKRPESRKKTTELKANFVDLSKPHHHNDYIIDNEINAESSEFEGRVQRYGNDDFYFNFKPEDNGKYRVKGNKRRKEERRRINYFSSPQKTSYNTDEATDGEMYLLRAKLAEIGASRFYPLLIKNGIMSLNHCTMKKLEKLNIPSRSRKKALTSAMMQLKQASKNINTGYSTTDLDLDFPSTGESEDYSEIEKGGTLGLKSALKKSSNKKRRSKAGFSKSRTGKSRHYFTPGELSLAETDKEPDHVKVLPTAKEEKDTDDAKSTDKKSVTFDLNDEDEISLPSYSDIEMNSDSEISIGSYDSS